MKGPVAKTCEHCKQTFECGQYGCWCGKLGITEEQMDWIVARFEDCLCPVCLNKATTGGLEALPTKPVTPARAD